jgi:cell division septum initiation protein DivIVA
MAEEFAMNKNDNEKYDNVIKMNENDLSEGVVAEEEIIDESDSMEIEVTQQPNAVFRRALLGGYKTVDVDKYIEQSKELLQSAFEENKQLKVKIDEMREGSITMKTALSSAMKFSCNISDAAKREATSLMENAHHAAKRFEQESAGLESSLSKEIDALRIQRDRITQELGATMESHIRLLDTVDMNSMSDETRDTIKHLLDLN